MNALIVFTFSIISCLEAETHFWDKIPAMKDFIADTLYIPMETNSLPWDNPDLTLSIIDNRSLEARTLGITQTKKYKYIPVDQHIMLRKTLADNIRFQFQKDSLELSGTFYINYLTTWYDSKPFFSKARVLSAHTQIMDSTGQVQRDWQWEIRIKKKRKQKVEDAISQAMQTWLESQSERLKTLTKAGQISPYPYGRQLMAWNDIIILSEGYILNPHLTLDFPYDHSKKWLRGSPGVFYRKTSFHESIAIGGPDQHWFYRINSSFLLHLNSSLRIGFNNFNRDVFDFMDFWNVFMINTGFTISGEYRPEYYKGVFAGIGFHQNIYILPILPDHLSIWEPGLMLTFGILLP